MKYSILFVMIFFCSVFNVMGQEYGRNRLMFSGGYSSGGTFTVESSYCRMFNQYVGICAGLRCDREGRAAGTPYGSIESGEYTSWGVDSDSRISNGALCLSAVFTSPAIFDCNGWKFNISAEPGIMLTVPYAKLNVKYQGSATCEYRSVSSLGGQWISFGGKAYLSFTTGRVSFGAGYGISDYDVYSANRRLTVEGQSLAAFYPQHTAVSHQLFLFTAYCF